MSNFLGFMHNDIVTSGYDIWIQGNDRGFMWDRQTVVMLCDNNNVAEGIRKELGRRRPPSSHTSSKGYEIDGYVNLNYSVDERDPANRNVRIVYCDMQIMTIEQVNDRFPNSYMIKVKERRDKIGDATQRIGRKVLEIPCNGGRTQ